MISGQPGGQGFLTPDHREYSPLRARLDHLSLSMLTLKAMASMIPSPYFLEAFSYFYRIFTHFFGAVDSILPRVVLISGNRYRFFGLPLN